MNAPFDPENAEMSGNFAIGQPVSRSEDPVLLRGQGQYTDDVSLPGQAHAVLLRSPYAHAILRGLDDAAARAMPGVLAIITAADLAAAGIGAMPAAGATNEDGTPSAKPRQMPFATDRLRYVGEPIAMVVAQTATQARDAAEAMLLDVAPLPAVTTASAAAAAGAPQIHAEAPGNIAHRYHAGDAQAVSAAFAAAAHVTRLELRNTRLVVCPMEPRSACARHDAESGRFTLHLGCQGVFGQRNGLAGILGVPVAQMRVLTARVGGSFGMKASIYPEYVALLHAARLLGRPVKWTDTRSESFVSDSHGRDHEILGELALDADGYFLALRLSGFGNAGAQLSNAVFLPATVNTLKNVVSVYRTPLVEVATAMVFTNTTPVGAYRGAGRPEGNYYMERLIDTAAAEMGIDRIALRRRNQIARAQIPYDAPSGLRYDSGDFPGVLDDALALADWDGFAARRAESAARGRVRGLGLGQYLEVTAPASKEMGGIRFDEDGGVTILTGTLDYGQGHASAFAQVLADRLGVPFGRIRLLQGDSDELLAGGGTGGSRSIMSSGAAIVAASALVIATGRQIAAHALEAAEADIVFEAGRFRIAGTDRAIGLLDLAAQLRAGLALPEGLPTSLDVRHVHDGTTATFPNGCHVAEVELDPETGVIEVVRYSMVNDFGTVINPLLVAGQAQGGVAQGIGQALLEETRYDADGQILSGSYMDYALPRATTMPGFAWSSHPMPATTNALGVKGCGEAGCAGSLPSVMNAVADALATYGIRHIDMPATPLRVWQAIRERVR